MFKTAGMGRRQVQSKYGGGFDDGRTSRGKRATTLREYADAVAQRTDPIASPVQRRPLRTGQTAVDSPGTPLQRASSAPMASAERAGGCGEAPLDDSPKSCWTGPGAGDVDNIAAAADDRQGGGAIMVDVPPFQKPSIIKLENMPDGQAHDSVPMSARSVGSTRTGGDTLSHHASTRSFPEFGTGPRSARSRRSSLPGVCLLSSRKQLWLGDPGQGPGASSLRGSVVVKAQKEEKAAETRKVSKELQTVMEEPPAKINTVAFSSNDIVDTDGAAMRRVFSSPAATRPKCAFGEGVHSEARSSPSCRPMLHVARAPAGKAIQVRLNGEGKTAYQLQTETDGIHPSVPGRRQQNDIASQLDIGSVTTEDKGSTVQTSTTACLSKHSFERKPGREVRASEGAQSARDPVDIDKRRYSDDVAPLIRNDSNTEKDASRGIEKELGAKRRSGDFNASQFRHDFPDPGKARLCMRTVEGKWATATGKFEEGAFRLGEDTAERVHKKPGEFKHSFDDFTKNGSRRDSGFRYEGEVASGRRRFSTGGESARMETSAATAFALRAGGGGRSSVAGVPSVDVKKETVGIKTADFNATSCVSHQIHRCLNHLSRDGVMREREKRLKNEAVFAQKCREVTDEAQTTERIAASIRSARHHTKSESIAGILNWGNH
eukprot:TRINITY_DN31946_c0_g1_i1.p1 TRINITY_DN31946_c0_g1~~TRINITY_DN31946_c0_g1_i1.p1  ORF type:complete len:661 (-),score=121.65 TRINITY_DN31946_c0_g1_i1:58-2040(-)